MTPPLTPSELIHAAKAAATVAHAGATDKAGNDYINHPRRVAARVAHYGPEFEAVAWLHDVIEDCEKVDAATLFKAGFPEAVVTAVEILSKFHGEEHADAVLRACGNPIAKVVKAADVADNSNPARSALIADMAKRETLRVKYVEARKILDQHDAPHFEIVPA